MPKKSIVFINQSSGYLMIDIINNHIEDFDEIILLTGFLNPRNKPLDESVKVHMLKAYNRKSSLKRFYSWIIFFCQSWYLVTFKYKKSVLYCVSNPPINVWFGLITKRKITFLIYDIYPDAFVSLKYLSQNSIMVKLWKKWNVKSFSKAINIYTISEGMKQRIEQYIDKTKTKVVPVWTDNFLTPKAKSENYLIEKWKISNKFVVLYSGNLGNTHPLELLIELANNLKDYSIEFVIIGEGQKKKALIELKEKYALNNVRFLPFQSTDILPYTLNIADVAVVTLNEEAGQLSVPSKTYNLMSCALPILAIAPDNSELNDLIIACNCGSCFNQSQLEEIREFVLKLLNDLKFRNELSKNSLKASKMFTSQNASKMLFEDVY